MLLPVVIFPYLVNDGKTCSGEAKTINRNVTCQSKWELPGLRLGPIGDPEDPSQVRCSS